MRGPLALTISHAQSQEVHGSQLPTLLVAMLRDAGHEGMPLAEIASSLKHIQAVGLWEQGEGGVAAEAPIPKLMAAALRFGLAAIIPGWKEARAVAAEHASRLCAAARGSCPPPRSLRLWMSAEGKINKFMARVLEQVSPPPPPALRCSPPPLRCLHSHVHRPSASARIRIPLPCTSFPPLHPQALHPQSPPSSHPPGLFHFRASSAPPTSQRALALVMRCPGMTEDRLMSALDILSPMSARILIAELVAAGLLTVRCVEAAAPARPPSLLLGQKRHSPQADAEERTRKVDGPPSLPLLLAPTSMKKRTWLGVFVDQSES